MNPRRYQGSEMKPTPVSLSHAVTGAAPAVGEIATELTTSPRYGMHFTTHCKLKVVVNFYCYMLEDLKSQL